MKIRSVFSAFIFLFTALTGLAAKPESSGPEPDALLKKLYQLNSAHKGPFFDRKNNGLVAQYFTPELAGLIVKDEVASKGEVGAYDFDPLYDSQDPDVKNFKIGEVHWPKDGVAAVTVTFKDGGKPRQLPFTFQQQKDKTWRISDIVYPDGSSLAGLLRKAYPAGKSK